MNFCICILVYIACGIVAGLLFRLLEWWCRFELTIIGLSGKKVNKFVLCLVFGYLSFIASVIITFIAILYSITNGRPNFCKNVVKTTKVIYVENYKPLEIK